MPPSTGSSNMMSALSRPDWGRPAGELSIFTAMAGRCGTLPLGAGSPVRGQAGPGAVDVVVVAFALATGSRGGEEEQALRSSPVSPAVASTPQASGRRALERSE